MENNKNCRTRIRSTFNLWIIPTIVINIINATIASELIRNKNIIYYALMFLLVAAYFMPVLLALHRNAKASNMKVMTFISKILVLAHFLWLAIGVIKTITGQL